jgi:hypothetical protein
MSISNDCNERRLVVPKADGNPEGKGAHGFLDDWRATEPRGVVAKPQRQVLAELFTSMLVLSASFKYQPASGSLNYLYWIDGRWSLSLVAPHEWSEERRAGFAATCVLQADMTWVISPSDRLAEDSEVTRAVRRFYDAFAEMLNTDLTLEEILPSYDASLHYYQRLYATALRRSVDAAVVRGGQASRSGRQWYQQLPRLNNLLLAHGG